MGISGQRGSDGRVRDRLTHNRGTLFRHRGTCDDGIGYSADVILVVAPTSTWVCAIRFVDAYRVLVSSSHRVEHQDADITLQRHSAIPKTQTFLFRHGVWGI